MRHCVIMSFLSVSFVYTVNRKKKRSEKERRRAMDGFMILGIVLLAAGFLYFGKAVRKLLFYLLRYTAD